MKKIFLACLSVILTFISAIQMAWAVDSKYKIIDAYPVYQTNNYYIAKPVIKMKSDDTNPRPFSNEDTRGEYSATVLGFQKMESVELSKNAQNLPNYHDLYVTYKIQLPQATSAGLGLTSAIGSEIVNKNADNKKVPVRNSAATGIVIGMVAGEMIGNKKYQEAIEKTNSERYIPMDMYRIDFELDNGYKGSFNSRAPNIEYKELNKIGKNFKFKKVNHEWFYD